jgi:uncharacterized protein YcfJ
MKKLLVLSAAASACSLLATNASAMDILARVLSSTPVVQQVGVPRQVCTTQAMLVESPRSGAGALLGALAGGVVGHNVGNGGGQALATMIGAVGGAMVGDNLEGPNRQLQNVQQCGTQTLYENRTTAYNVVYEYADKPYSIMMASDPGPYVRLQVTPVGAIPTPSQGNVFPGQAYEQPVYGQPVYTVPVYSQPVYAQPTVIAPVVAYPGYYAQPYYPPIGVSIGFGYSRGGHRGHWR